MTTEAPTEVARDGGAEVLGAAGLEPGTLDDALAVLAERGGDAMAEILRGRVEQRSAKMKLGRESARDAALQVVEAIDRSVPIRALARVLPHSTIELARANHERGVAAADADGIATYLLAFIQVLRFDNLRRLDINHSHVVGREWQQIDYSGEGMTWQGQKAYWAPRGVMDFKKAEHIHAYFRHASKLPHFDRVYRPGGSMDDLIWPPTDSQLEKPE